MTTQEAYDDIRAYFTRPGAKLAVSSSSTNTTPCKYRTEDGDQCAVGCLIPEALYSPRMEDQPLKALLRSFPDVATHLCWTPETVAFLQGAQRRHDQSAWYEHRSLGGDGVRRFIGLLDELAECLGLELSYKAHLNTSVAMAAFAGEGEGEE